jgi:hypothetical protein
MRVPFLPPHPHQHLLLFVFLVTDTLTEVRWNLNVVLICISFMARDTEYFFMLNYLFLFFYIFTKLYCFTSAITMIYWNLHFYSLLCSREPLPKSMYHILSLKHTHGRHPLKWSPIILVPDIYALMWFLTLNVG